MPFVTLDVDVVLKPLIQSFQTPRPYPQSNQHLIFLYHFLSQGFGGFSSPTDDFSPIDRFFSPIEPPVFPPRFLIEFRRCFHQSNTHGFLLSFLLGLKGFVPQCHNHKRLYARRSLRPRGKVIVMSWSHVTSHMIDLTRSEQFQIITDPAPRGWLSHQSPDLPNQPSDFWINLLDQLFESTFQINL